MSFLVPGVIALHLENEERQKLLWFLFGKVSKQANTKSLFCQMRAALLGGSPWSHQPMLLHYTHWQSKSQGRVLSAMPPSLEISAVLFRHRGNLFLFHFASINSFPFFPVVFIEYCGPIDHMRSLLIASALETSRFTRLHSPGCRLMWLARAGSHPPLCYSEFSHPCLPALEFLVYFPDAGWISSIMYR